MKKSHGYSLVEVLITLAIFVVVGVLILSILLQNNNLFYNQNARVTNNIELNNAIAAISANVKSSSAVVLSNSGYSTSANVLIVSIPSIDDAGNLIAGTYDYYIVTRDSQKSNILREILISSAASSRESFNHVLLTNLESVDFSYLDSLGNGVPPANAGKIQFTLIESKLVNNKLQQASSSGQILLRNK